MQIINKKTVNKVKSRLYVLFTTSIATLFLTTQAVQAAIPTNQEPSKGSDDDNILKTWFAYSYDIVLYGGAAGIAAASLYYLIHMWGIFQEVRAQKKEKSDLITDGVIGASLLLLTIWGVTFALARLENA
ncbi:hypothetical protein TUM4438_10400 [Shewanella sairae]|uniref:TIGR03745 family integrating conjugative element membrane protein n=1 Tax=Shewanella sairae TaxID=190310 RepID=A0ABQ4P5V8_9GAMM|nr:TIGR03745 family integrating conjugative element membrane protein [Shewanella sairae]MCL1130474.1 TIGR03745 family integrating conjugative element membrane protein [Shewanella sairae]GIU42860.1 hypothetical protein TUM4438_10400 [Shewanella sairae]